MLRAWNNHPIMSMLSGHGSRIKRKNKEYILAGNIHNSYLNAPTKEKVFFTLVMNENLIKEKLLLLLELSLV